MGSSAWGGLLLVLFLRSGPDTLTRKEEGSAEEGAEMNGMPLYTLTTRLGPKEADHSYNGIIFDVESKAPYEVVVTAVWVAGMLGNVRAFVRDQPWSGHDLRPKARQSMWGNRYIIEKEGWEQVADVQCSPSWDKCPAHSGTLVYQGTLGPPTGLSLARLRRLRQLLPAPPPAPPPSPS